MNKIIGLVGFIGSGKGTASEHLQMQHNFIQESFAKSLKDSVAAIFGWDRALLEGDTLESRGWREIVDEWWSSRLGIPNLTPRMVLQFMGTDVCRNNFHQDIWIASVENRLLHSHTNIVLSDVRFINELKSIKNIGGTIIRIKRGPEPEWFDDAMKTNLGQNDIMKFNNTVHPSEWGWIGGEIDYTIENNGTKEDLHNKIDYVLKMIDGK